MEAKTLMVSICAVFAVILALSMVSASYGVSLQSVEANDYDLKDGFGDLVLFSKESVSLKIALQSYEEDKDVRVRAWIPGAREKIEASTERFNILGDGRIYTKYLTLNVPADIDLTDSYTLHISVEGRAGSYEETFELNLQRPSYNIEILSVENERSVAAGNSVAIDVVVKNRGYSRLDDNFVIVRIPELEISKKAYFGDLTPIDEENDDEDENEDTVAGRVYLPIPADAEAGVYTLEVEAYNADSSDLVSKNVIVSGNEQRSDVLVPVKTKDVSKGSEAVYEMILVNTGSKIAVYEIIPETVEGITVRVSEPIVTVGPDASKTVQVTVKGLSSGTYGFGVNVHTDGKLVKRVPLVANVTGGVIGTGSNTIVLTVVLAIIFLVLLIVLIVLLTRKPKKTEEFGESYY